MFGRLFFFKALNSAWGLPFTDVTPELITELFFTTKQPTEGLVLVFPMFFSAILKAKFEKKL